MQNDESETESNALAEVLDRTPGAYHEPLHMVRVVDATHSTKGERKEYFLRLPPEIETAREAVAWTFGLSREEYNPTVQA